MGHGHSHSAAGANKHRLAIVFGLTAAYLIAEVIGGLVTGSLALLADAGHMLTDVAGLGLALMAIKFAERPATPERTYGYYRVEILVALTNAVVLIGISLYILYEAWERFRNPPEVASGPMLVVATIGLVINIIGIVILRKGSQESLNMKGAYFEVVTLQERGADEHQVSERSACARRDVPNVRCPTAAAPYREGDVEVAATLEGMEQRRAQIRRGQLLEYFTVGYNSLEGVVAIGSGVLAGSIALVGFGFDSAIEVISGCVLLWRLYGDADESRRERIEQRALRIIGVSFFVLGAYVTFDAVKSLVRREAPEESMVGIVLAAVSVVVMPLLVRAKRRVARSIGSAALNADATQTQICTYLSAILLGGLVLNAVVGWWWADPLAALVMVPIVVKEGWEVIRGEHCDDCHP